MVEKIVADVQDRLRQPNPAGQLEFPLPQPRRLGR